MPEHLRSTLAFFAKRGAERTAAEIAERNEDQIAVTAINNRLERLRKLGLLDRRRVGHAFVYRMIVDKPMN